MIRKNKTGAQRINSGWGGWLWPTIDSVFVAKIVAGRAAGAAMIQAIGIGILATLSLMGIDVRTVVNSGSVDLISCALVAYLFAIFYALIAYFLYYKQSRVAAIVALLNYAGEFAFSIATTGSGRPTLMMVFFVLAYVNGVRATFMLKRTENSEHCFAQKSIATDHPRLGQ